MVKLKLQKRLNPIGIIGIFSWAFNFAFFSTGLSLLFQSLGSSLISSNIFATFLGMISFIAMVSSIKIYTWEKN